MKTRFEKLAKDLDIDIVITWGHGMHQEAKQDPDAQDCKLHIWDYGTLDTSGQNNYLDYLYEGSGEAYIRLQDRYVLRSSGSLTKMDEYAAVPPANTYQFGEFDLFNMWYTATLRNFCSSQKKFDRYIAKYAKRAIDRNDREDRLKEMEDKTREAFLKHMASLSGRKVKDTKRRVQTLEASLVQLQEQQVTTHASLEDEMDKLNYLESLASTKKDFYKDQIDNLLDHVDFERVLYNDVSKALEMYTKDMWLYSPSRKKRTPLGKFKIAYTVDNKKISITNLTNKQGGRDHPHVESSRPCWGSGQGAIVDAATSSDVVTLFSFIVGYLESYNPRDSWGRYAAYWFDKQKDQTEYLAEDGVYRTKAEQKKFEEGGTNESPLEGILDTAVAAVSQAEIENTPQES